MQNQGGWPPNQDPYGPPVGQQPPGGSFGSPGYGYGPIQPAYPPPGYQQQYGGGSASGRAIAALVLAIASWLACSCVTGIPAFFLARSELQAIEQGQAPYAGKGLAQAAYWIGLVNIVMAGLVLIVYAAVFLFAMAN